MSASEGYSACTILDRAVQATRKVKDGQAAFERDGIVFPMMEANLSLVGALKRAAARYGRWHVLDFGGALGSTYFQSREYASASVPVKWAIVEQPAHVEAGMREFASEELSFYRTIDEACSDAAYEVLLLSGVIQYLPDPHDFLDMVLKRQFPFVIIDRVPLMINGTTRLTVQHVPKRIYPASYPSWFFSERDILRRFKQSYERVSVWPALDRHHPEGGRAEYKGFLFELRNELKS
jgi:putative methyltransferase (TIGR04325 family)